MAPFSIPTPSIIPLRLPIFGGPKSIDTKTKIQILCETYLEHEIFYTIDGTKPQPYAGIVQGNKTVKYTSPFCLPSGKITIKAMAINSVVHTMCSSVVTKCFDVLKAEGDESSKAKQSKHIKKLKCDSKKNSPVKTNKNEAFPGSSDERLECGAILDNEAHSNCLEEAFIGSSDFELESQKDATEEKNCFPLSKNNLDINDNLELSETVPCILENSSCENDFVSEVVEKSTLDSDKITDTSTPTLVDSGTSIETQFCCLKCDMTLQQCSNCNKMNAISSKFCISCGDQLLQMCYLCKEWNFVIAKFCQFCGKKLGSRMEPYIKLDQLDQGVMVKPVIKNIATQVFPEVANKSTQTMHDRNLARRHSSGSRRMPPMSPGRGYWHQQLDYICNHLKTYAYNNLEFRQEISEPFLCDFNSAHVVKEKENVIVSLSFTHFVPDKSALPPPKELKSERKHHESS